MAVLAPNAIHQASIELDKHTKAYSKYEPVVGRGSIVLSNGQQWKAIRGEFNPSFAPSRLLNALPAIITEAETLVARLEAIACSGSARTESFEALAAAATGGIIGQVTLGSSLNAQVSKENLVEDLATLTRLISTKSLISNMCDTDGIKKLTAKTSGEIRRRVSELLQISRESRTLGKIRTTSIVDAVLNRKRASGNDVTSRTIDELTENVKTVIFAGIDTSSSVLSHIFYLLSQNRSALEKVRQEHDEVLGNDPTQASKSLLAEPSLLNRLPYTLAVIKESMRLFTPIGSTRIGKKHIQLQSLNDGLPHETEGCMVYLAGPALHRDPSFFPEPSTFRPERFLLEGRGHGCPEIPKYAYRPFEMGPRACLGQDLAILEIKVLVVLLVRRFDLEPAYTGEMDKRNGIAGYGERAYQTMYTTAKPSDGIPMRVHLAT